MISITLLPPFFQLHHYPLVTSTNDLIRDLVKQGKGRDGLIVQADQQTAGRGRRGRSWVSPIGNFYMSMLVEKIPKQSLQEVAQVGFVASLSMAVAINHLIGRPKTVQIKWPNDLLINKRKCAGMLLETLPPGNSTDPFFIILGIGVNITSFPEGLPYLATSLKEVQENSNISIRQLLGQFCDDFLPRLENWRAGNFVDIRKEWLEYACGISEDILVHLPSETIAGKFVDLNDQGQLLLENAAGIRKITVGDVFFPTRRD